MNCVPFGEFTITYAEGKTNRLPRPERRGLRSQDGHPGPAPVACHDTDAR
jgi:hypothetical protein